MSDLLKQVILNNMSGFIEFLKLHQDGQIYDLKTDDEYRNKLVEIIDNLFLCRNKIITFYPEYKDRFLKTLSIKLFELGSYYAEIPGCADRAKKYFKNAFQIINPKDISDSLIELYTKSAEENPMPFYEKFRHLCQYDGIDSDISDNDAFRTELEFNIGIICKYLNNVMKMLPLQDKQEFMQNLTDTTSKLEQYYHNCAIKLMSENFELNFKYFARAENYTIIKDNLSKLYGIRSQISTPNKLPDPTDTTKNEPPISLELLELDPPARMPKLGNSPTNPEEKEPADTKNENTRKTRSPSI